MRRVRFDRLLASTALGVVLMLSSHAGMAQKSGKKFGKVIEASVPMPDTSLPAPLTAKDVEGKPSEAAPANTTAEPAATPANTTAEPAKYAAPAAASDDSAVADKLREIITGKSLDHFLSRKTDRAGIEQFYNARNFAPLWVNGGAANERAKSAIAYLAQADTVGLDAADYPVPDFKSATTADAMAEAEIKFTATALTFARHAQIGRIHYSRVSADIAFNLVAPESADVLAKLADGNDAGKALDGFNPPHAGFNALKAKLAELRKGAAVPTAEEEKKPDPVKVAEGKILRPGMKDPRVISLRHRLNIAGDKDNPLYDDTVRDAVSTFQTEADIGVDGNLGTNTVRALNGEKQVTRRPSADPIDTIVVNMERWRWLPRDLGNPRVIVNIPDYRLALYNDDAVYWGTKIVVGKPSLVTPMISAEMKFITVNPTWNVPPSIIEKEYLPALEADPMALERIGLKVTQDADGTVHVSQPPGAGNALGRIRFNFPNKFLVYQHDTPQKYLFAQNKRAFSHGCMRVQNPLTYGEKLLSLVMPNEHYTEARLEKMFGGSEVDIKFPKFVAVHLTYQTAFVEEDGKLQLREDVYGRDARMIAILKGNERKVADISVDHPPNASGRSVRLTPGMYGGEGPRYNGGDFFGWLFNGPRAQQQTMRPRGTVGPRAQTSNGRVTTR